MDQLNRLDKYFKEKERKRLDIIRNESRGGLPEMTLAEIRLSCLENNGYESPQLNDKLYLHFRGFKKIENLDQYTGCKAIWLDSNGFELIEGLDKMVELRCLYLSKNLLGEINGLENLTQLITIDLSNNRLTTINGLSCCPLLETVNVSKNSLASPESVEHFQECRNLKSIDLTMNRLECNESFLPAFAAIPALVTLSLNGNEVTKLPSFRKRCIYSLPKLGYLDRPIEEVERLCAVAFVTGGPEAEKVARDAHRDQVNKKRSDEMAQFRLWQEEQARVRAQAKAEGRSLLPEPTEEELEARRAEARRDTEEERRILSLGVDKVAARFWQLEGEGNCQDALSEAGKQLLEEERLRGQKIPATEEWPRVVELPAEDEDDVHFNTSCVPTIRPAAAAAPEFPAATAMEETKSFEPEMATVLPQPPSVSTVNPPVAAEKDCDLEMVAHVSEDPKEEYVRQKRIADSMEIYKRQLAVAKAAGKKLTLGTGVSDLLAENAATEATLHTAPTPQPVIVAKEKSTWDAAAVVQPPQPREEKAYWSEDMDISLAKLVRAKMFDFDAVAAALQEQAGPGCRLEKVVKRAGFSPELLNASACRVRWAELDAEKWSTTAPDSTPMDTNFNVYVTPSMISAAGGHGGQPSFQALATMAAGSMPTYLNPPTSFPSVADIEEEEDEDGDVAVFLIPPPLIPVNFDAMD